MSILKDLDPEYAKIHTKAPAKRSLGKMLTLGFVGLSCAALAGYAMLTNSPPAVKLPQVSEPIAASPVAPNTPAPVSLAMAPVRPSSAETLPPVPATIMLDPIDALPLAQKKEITKTASPSVVRKSPSRPKNRIEKKVNSEIKPDQTSKKTAAISSNKPKIKVAAIQPQKSAATQSKTTSAAPQLRVEDTRPSDKPTKKPVQASIKEAKAPAEKSSDKSSSEKKSATSSVDRDASIVSSLFK